MPPNRIVCTAGCIWKNFYSSQMTHLLNCLIGRMNKIWLYCWVLFECNSAQNGLIGWGWGAKDGANKFKRWGCVRFLDENKNFLSMSIVMIIQILRCWHRFSIEYCIREDF